MNQFPQFDLTGQVALVTGAARGLGRAISLALAHSGADVALGLRDLNTSGELAREIRTMGRKALPLQMDVLHLDQITRAVDETIAYFGRLDILINNAGGGPMMRQKGGRIINLSSTAAFVALPTEPIYCMSKGAISQLTKCLAVEWGKHNITVNAVAPTWITTPGTDEALADPAFRADVIERIAGLHRIGEPADVTGAVVFLASPAASLITGHTILIDGGWTAQ